MFSFEPQPCHFLPQDSQNTQTIQSTFGNSRLAALLDPGSDRRLLFRLPWYWIGILSLLTKRTNLSNGSNNMLRSGYECNSDILFLFLHRGTKNWNSSISPWRPATIIIYFLICWARPITVLSYWCYVIRWARINICKAASFPGIVSIVCSCSVKIISIGIRNRAPNSMIGITGYRVASTTICPFVPRLVIQNSFLQHLSLRQILPSGTQDNVRWQHILHALAFRVGRNQLLCSEHLRIHWLCGSLLWGLDISPIICPVRIFHYWRPSLLFRFIVLATSWSALCCI